MTSVEDNIYEFACHSGNYAMAGILRAGRVEVAVVFLGGGWREMGVGHLVVYWPTAKSTIRVPCNYKEI